jgi:hypothetical protein
MLEMLGMHGFSNRRRAFAMVMESFYQCLDTKSRGKFELGPSHINAAILFDKAATAFVLAKWKQPVI